MPRASVNGIELYYELHGPEDRPLLVLNNGILMSTASWFLQIPALAQRYRVLLYDCRGQGQSDHPDAAWDMSQHAEDLAGLLDQVGVDQAHVLGISYGGEVAQAFALAHPRRIASLTLADTVSEVGSALRNVIEEWREVAATDDPERFFAVTVPWTFSLEFTDAHPEFIAESRRRYHLLDYPAVVRLCDCFLTSVHFTSRLGRITAPTCVIVGELDVLKDLSYAERIHQAIARSELHVIPTAGHASCLERPEEFNDIVLEFLDKLES